MLSIVVFSCSDIDSLEETQRAAVDFLGELSGMAQDLKGPITSIEKLKESSEQSIVVCLDSANEPIGFLKYGTKKLFFYRKNGQVEEHTPLCLLDFYVKDSFQRHGIGLQLFQKFLEINTPLDPSKVAYDRPSIKLLGFMAKHFHLVVPDLQPNRYTIFEGFF